MIKVMVVAILHHLFHHRRFSVPQLCSRITGVGLIPHLRRIRFNTNQAPPS
ncbi:uncharacterized protein DS421_9g270080 [Arachis hypogaea]|nr:uncharacterized protein DS421_9g270080 [Arachis hypogaea]